MLGTNLNIKSYIGYFELFGERVSLNEIKKRLRAFKLSNVVGELVRLNTLLVLSLHNDKKLRMAQRRLAQNFLDKDIWVALKSKCGPEMMEQRPVFFPQQILTLLRMSLLVCTENASLIAEGKTDAGYALGCCCLMITDHLISKKQERAIAEGTSAKQRKHLGLQTAPTRELYNQTNFQRAVVLTEIMFADLLKAYRGEIKGKLQGFDLPYEFRKATGMSLSKYCDLVFVTFAYYETKEPEEFIQNDGGCAINRASYFAGGAVSKKDLDAFLNLDSIKLRYLPIIINATRKALPPFDFTVFRRHPLIEFPGGNLMCVNPSFVLEKLSTGLNWTIVNSFGGNRTKSGKALEAFGLLFERYVNRLMQQIYPSKMRLFSSFPHFANGEEAFDGALCIGDHLIAFEYKGGGLTLEAKYSGKIRLFERELDRKFGIGKDGGVFQLARKIELLFHKDRSRRYQIPDLNAVISKVTKITPVLIVQEPFLRGDFLNWMLNSRFKKMIQKSKVKPIEIAPLQVIDIESLERLKPNLMARDFSLDQCLNARACDDPEVIYSFNTFPWKKYFSSFGTREDEEVTKRSKAILSRVRKTIFGSIAAQATP
jgi:hypothetical protein